MVSLAVMWRLPVLHARDPEDSLRVLRFVARQLRNSDPGILQRYDRKPKRLASRKLYVLQGLPGLVRHRRVGCCFSSAPSSALSPRVKTRGQKSAASVARRRRGSENSFGKRPLALDGRGEA